MPQPRLFRLAPEAFAVTAHYEHGRGWALRVVVRRQDEQWDEAHCETYQQLSTPEALDVLLADLELALEAR